MSERTIIITAEITEIHNNVPQGCVLTETKQELAQALKEDLHVDGVVVTNVQEFIGGAE